MAPRKRTEAHAESSAAASRIEAQLGGLGTVLKPEDAPEPILTPLVRQTIYEWLAEINSADDLKAVGVKPRSTALLYGPPGTGKTTLAHHLAARLNIPLVSVGAENLVSMWLGESGKNVSRLFDAVKRADTRCIVFVDEIDAVGSKRENNKGGGADNERNATMSVLLRRIEQFEGMFIGATNLKDNLDTALWRRFSMQIPVELPGHPERWAIIKTYLAPFTWDDDAITDLAAYLEGAPPSLIRQLIEGVKRRVIIGGRINKPANDVAQAFLPVIASVRVHPDYNEPPLWKDRARCMEVLAGHSWPLEREEPKV